MTILLQFSNLLVGYGTRRRRMGVVAGPLSGTLQSGRLVALVGRNGAGKSSFLRTLCGLQPPAGGQLLLGERPIDRLSRSELARQVAAVLTERVADGRVRAAEVVAAGRYPHTGFSGRLSAADRAAVAQALERVQATALAERPMASLSDGEQQRIMMAKALAQDTPIVLLDEPTAFLDFAAVPAWLQLLARLAHEEQKAVLFSTHHLEAALRVADEVWLLDGGRLQQGSPRALAQSGALGRVFDSPAAHLDPHTLRFVFDSPRP